MSTAPRPLVALRRARRRARARGFTLIELTVSLVAGLIVAMGVIALSREATSSFNEEIRLSSAESSLRTAIDRLRSDLQRSAFMSTGNIARDPKIAGGLALGNPNVSTAASSKFKGLGRLAGIHLFFGGSAANTPLSAAQAVAPPAASANGKPAPLLPDALEIGGNFTSNDQFVVRNVDLPNGSCQRVWLAVDSPPMYRILATGTAADTNLRNAFQPILQNTPAGGGTATSYQYLVRITDDSGKYQYAVTCPTATGGAATSPPSPWVDIDTTTTLLTTQQTATTGGVAGLGVGRLTINPVQVVRWEITTLSTANATTAALAAALNPTNDPNKYDLVRSYVDAFGNVVPESTEVVGEYAIDLKFGFTVDSDPKTIGATDPNTQTGGPVYQTLSFDSPANAAWAPDVSQWLQPATAPAAGPQRIRSVRVRLVTRTAIADRQTNIAPNPANVAAAPSGSTSELFLYRYCAGQITQNDGGTATLPDCSNGGWARARTVTTEVDLPNQASMHFL